MTAERIDVVLAAVELERQRQDRLLEDGKIEWNLADVTVGDGKKLVVIGEEYGEVCRAVLGGDSDNLYAELIQLAACVVAMAESVHELRSYMREALVGS